MKNKFKNPLLLVGSVAALAGSSFFSTERNVVKAEECCVRYCEWFDQPGAPWDGCKTPAIVFYCICEDQC